MGSPLSPILANLVMEDIENKAMSEFHHPPKVWKHYVDNTFVVIKLEYLQQFFNFLNSIEPTVKFKLLPCKQKPTAVFFNRGSTEP